MTIGRRGRVAAWGLAGALLGVGVFSKWAEADCGPPTWPVALNAVTAGDGEATDETWPQAGTLTAYEGHVHLVTTAAFKAGAVARVEADR